MGWKTQSTKVQIRRNGLYISKQLDEREERGRDGEGGFGEDARRTKIWSDPKFTTEQATFSNVSSPQVVIKKKEKIRKMLLILSNPKV